jgi:hypothetical protein
MYEGHDKVWLDRKGESGRLHDTPSPNPMNLGTKPLPLLRLYMFNHRITEDPVKVSFWPRNRDTVIQDDLRGYVFPFFVGGLPVRRDIQERNVVLRGVNPNLLPEMYAPSQVQYPL